jgi:hypothetical protein
MSTSSEASTLDQTVPSQAQALFAAEGLPFPPVPTRLASALQAQGRAWYATRAMASTPYDLEHFLFEASSQPDLPEYAVVGFDGHGTNSWAAHYYLVVKSLALFIQLPWGGAYTDPEPARENIAAMIDWAAELQSRLEQADAVQRIPEGMRLEVAASHFGRAGWRWVGGGRDASTTSWNPSAGMLDAILAEVGDVVDGKRTLQEG